MRKSLIYIHVIFMIASLTCVSSVIADEIFSGYPEDAYFGEDYTPKSYFGDDIFGGYTPSSYFGDDIFGGFSPSAPLSPFS